MILTCCYHLIMEKELLFSQIIDVKPYRISKSKTLVLGVTLTLIGFLSAKINLVLGIALPLWILTGILSLIYHNIQFSFYLTFSRAQWEDDFSYVTIQTKIQQQTSKCNVFKPLLKKIRRINQREFLIQLRGKTYSCNRQGVREINDAERLKMIGVDNLSKYSQIGLYGQVYAKSINLFGKQEDLFEPNIFKMLSRFFWQQTGQIFTCLLALIAAAVSLYKSESLTLFLHLSIQGLAFLIVFIQICIRKYHFHSFYSNFSQMMYNVIRQGQKIRVKLSDLLIGDIVKIRLQKQQEELILFRGVLLGNQDLQVMQGKENKQSFKKPLKDFTQIEQQIRCKRHTIYPRTRILNFQKQQVGSISVTILVTDRPLSNYFKIWFEKPHQHEYESISKRIQLQKIKLLLAGSGLLVGFHLLSCLLYRKGLLQQTKQLNLSLLCTSFPILFIANQLVLLITTLRMKYNQIIMLQSNLQKVSFCPTIFLDDFKQQLKFKFSELLYKNKIFKYKTEQFIPNSDLKASSTEDSQLALILYISLGKLQTQFSFLQKTYQKFSDQFQYDTSQSQILVIHKNSKKKWTVQKIFPVDEKGIRSWLVQFDNRATYLISELNQVNESIFNLLRNQGESRKRDLYAEEARLKIDQGKQIKAMFYRNFKDQQLRGSTLPEVNLLEEPRENLQMRYEFGTLVVFDNQIPQSISEAINQIKQRSIKNQKLIQFILLTQEGRKIIQGFQHHLQGVPIKHSCTIKNKEKQIRQSLSKKGTIFIGNTDQNYQFHSMVDFAGQLTKQEEKLDFPTDVLLKYATQIPDLLCYSRWVLQSTIQNIKLGFFYVFFQLIGRLYIIHTKITKNNDQMQHLKDIIIFICFLILAGILRQLVSSRPPANKHMKNITLYSPNFYISFLFIICSAIAWIVFDIKDKICHYQIVRNLSVQSLKCLEVDQFIGRWAGVLIFCIFYNQQSWIGGQDWGRLLIAPIWLSLLYFNNIGLNTCLGLLFGLLVLTGLKKSWRLLRKCF